jgi:zinc transporter ZupT
MRADLFACEDKPMDTRILGLALALVAGLADILGGSLIAGRARLSGRTLTYLLGLGGGFMLAAAILGRLPEAMAATPAAPMLVVVGYMLIFVCENLFSTHAHGDQAEHIHEGADEDWHGTGAGAAGDRPSVDHSHALVGGDLICEPETPISNAASLAALAGLLIHTFFDGVAIAAGFELRESVGILMFLAVLLHKIPEGLSLSSIMIAARQGRRGAFLAVVAIAASTFLGALSTFALGELEPATAHAALALATGTLIYIAASDLIPATNPAKSRWSILFVLAGVGLYAVSLQALRVLGLE